ncbi:MAG: hypothetical protein H7144_18465 [Burkholderiales bacterium]|nr:hypothetical protein [Phycisphaerae bacterium]
MAKVLKTDPIIAEDIKEHVLKESDFAFELNVLSSLKAMGLAVAHSGTYTDPATGKPRQFDIRAEKHHGCDALRMAVECKNLQPYNPLIVLCVDRPNSDAFYEVCFSSRFRRSEPNLEIFKAIHSLYRFNEPVGKSTVQLAFAPSTEKGVEKKAVLDDSEVYDKWAQAVSSCSDLVKFAEEDGPRKSQDCSACLIVPVLVIPNGTLWSCRFNSSGATDEPEVVDHVSMLIDKSYALSIYTPKMEMRLSHLEIVTPNGLASLVDRLWTSGLLTPEVQGAAKQFGKRLSAH